MYRFIKRALDILLSMVGLAALCPLLLLLMLLIRLDSPGSPLFRQQRVGRDGRLFEIYKLRTMNTNAPRDVATAELCDADAHITRLGRILRKTSLDELPQLLNVLFGQMSLIGPRPLVPGEKGIHEARMALGAYTVRPGITGWAQVNGLRGDTSIRARVDYDLYYIENWSMLFDIKILLMTPFKGVVNRQESLK